MTDSNRSDPSITDEAERRVAIALCGGSTWAWNEATEQTRDFWRRQARAALAAAAPLIRSSIEAEIRAEIADEIGKRRESLDWDEAFTVYDAYGDAYRIAARGAAAGPGEQR